MNYWIIIFLLGRYSYGSYNRAIIKQKHGIRGLVQDHHIIPRQFSKIVNIDIDSSRNLIMLPTSYGKLYLNTTRPIHENGHPNYNKYIKHLLDENYSEDYILKFLKKQILSDELHKII
jgi:hypothetical protein